MQVILKQDNDEVKAAVFEEVKTILYNLKPYEKIYISADQGGRPHLFRVELSRDVIINGLLLKYKK